MLVLWAMCMIGCLLGCLVIVFGWFGVNVLFCWFCFVLVGFTSVWGVVRCSWFSASAVVYCICVVTCLGCFGVV